MKRKWKIYYHGWVITHDPLGTLACYWDGDNTLNWCYFGTTLAAIKRMIDERRLCT